MRDFSVLSNDLDIARKLSYRIEDDEEERAINQISTPTLDWSKPMGCRCAFCPYLLQLVFVASLGSFASGLSLTSLTNCIDYISWEFAWCGPKEEIAGCSQAIDYKLYIETAVFAGAALGAICGGYLLSVGRRTTMIICMAIFVFGFISSAVANSFPFLLWARLSCGIAVGINFVAMPAYIAEMATTNKRGFYGVFHQLFVTLGLLAGILLALPLPLAYPLPPIAYPKMDLFPKVWWRVMLGIGIVPALTCAGLLGIVYKPETPQYYLNKGLCGDAQCLLRRLYRREDVASELMLVRHDLDGSKIVKGSKSAVWAISFSLLLAALQQLSGLVIFIGHTTALTHGSSLVDHWPVIVSNLKFVLMFLMTLVTMFLIDKIGRKILMIIGTLGMIASTAPVAVCSWITDENNPHKLIRRTDIGGTIGIMVFFALAYGPVLWVYLPEIFPAGMRGTATGFASSCTWLSVVGMLYINRYVSQKYYFTIFLSACAIAFAIVLFGMKETKGLPLGQSPFFKRLHNVKTSSAFSSPSL